MQNMCFQPFYIGRTHKPKAGYRLAFVFFPHFAGSPSHFQSETSRYHSVLYMDPLNHQNPKNELKSIPLSKRKLHILKIWHLPTFKVVWLSNNLLKLPKSLPRSNNQNKSFCLSLGWKPSKMMTDVDSTRLFWTQLCTVLGKPDKK